LDEELEMPLYDYRCSACGDFRAWRRMSEAAEPAECPSCAAPAARAVVAPSLALMNGHTRIAHQRNEKSAHEPQVVSRSEHGHRHDHGHGGAHHHHQHGSGQRPWMIGD
jgi:putative FmdB family regulatory protein